MTGDRGGAPRKGDDEVFVAGFAAGLSTSSVASLAGVSERTARRRRHEPTIEALIRRRRAELAEDTAGRIVALGAQALSAIEDCLDSAELKDRMAAARVVLQLGPRFRADVEFEQRLRDLENPGGAYVAETDTPDPIWMENDNDLKE